MPSSFPGKFHETFKVQMAAILFKHFQRTEKEKISIAKAKITLMPKQIGIG